MAGGTSVIHRLPVLYVVCAGTCALYYWQGIQATPRSVQRQAPRRGYIGDAAYRARGRAGQHGQHKRAFICIM